MIINAIANPSQPSHTKSIIRCCDDARTHTGIDDMATLSITLPKAEPEAYLLCAMRVVWIAIPLVLLLPLHLIWHLLKLPSPWAMLFLRISARALGAKVTVFGKPLRIEVFFVANHLSWHDIPILAGITGSAFVAQDGVRDCRSGGCRRCPRCREPPRASV